MTELLSQQGRSICAAQDAGRGRFVWSFGSSWDGCLFFASAPVCCACTSTMHAQSHLQAVLHGGADLFGADRGGEVTKREGEVAYRLP